MSASDLFGIRFSGDELIILNQVKLPFQEEYIRTADVERIAVAIERLEIRGAPLIGIAAAYALALSQKYGYSDSGFMAAYTRLAATRPTAVNLFWALNRMKDFCFSLSPELRGYTALAALAAEIDAEDARRCNQIAANALALFPESAVVLTHCNTGRLVAGGGGTALFAIETAWRQGKVHKVFADETRPLLQGSRLTAFELSRLGIPFAILPDGAAASLFREKKISLAITGADRIAANGDTANKVGTSALAVLCNYYGVPFYIAAPASTVDAAVPDGSAINIEQRSAAEVHTINGAQVTLNSYPVYNPAFDVTPASLITAIITDEGVFRYPYNFAR